ncbi:urate hydroxylase PuuD [Ponticoccus sp. SC2-23]|uniref:urate hydroxylase PuuD n=1 Tax=Alexandriicola marinus TaxID=2081710 RepID=UPI000FDB53D4|nr:urate hydroxylase PuuD [Alexandriicola marinus]MBM1220800.1 urate hydroxylase PuuD [Ponticoccus sp. SC6-9]MBM1225370.1 urate hydroxylase PuuD [Ponticoccus sp. SC6-15]MBM1227553.1 urate hydroxylase PuuD [Ponticoccus sp. SC6-38]MBM1234809.1 urate hydroxylase PuuD [Ponticoccus sp. SC6-45]MBM1238055.1 urate hydroxylase PuuD [Ponticoccus sp. SC6-49]MBM1244312.1 urate hydroxylase PuuD [Ponticoccus sp. SC2-64]MBM1248333.1 urate hydroxylase PuuD [Ponticoccus sp. SC6-42]MBM1252455.1 urate hydroxy
MYDLAILWDWTAFAVRWLHVITAVAWIGSSFYFIALDLGLKRDIPGPADGEEWQVHGGGFYHIQKYLVAPDALPEHLTWFKWEAYSTWLSGAALLMIVYWVGGELFLLDPTKADLALWQGIAISAATIAVGWLLYDALCKSKLGDYPTSMMVALFAIIVAMSWGLNQVFTGRAALLHLGAFTATIMSANVFFIIIPNQKVVVADLKAGRTPDPKYGKIAKLRSTHNNYLTLPVIFLMLSNHYPLAFGTEYAWIIASLVFMMGVTIRHFFNSMHARKGRPHWTWAVTAALFLVIAWLSTQPGMDSYDEAEARPLTAIEAQFANAAGFDAAYDTVIGNCSMCHAREPVWGNMQWPPKGIVLETESDIARHAKLVYLQAGVSHAMPPPNAIQMDPQARADIVEWYRAATGS